MSPCKLLKALKWAILGPILQHKGSLGECGGKGKGERGGVREECWGHVSLSWGMVIVGGHRQGAREKRARKGFKGAVWEEVAGIVHGVPQHAS